MSNDKDFIARHTAEVTLKDGSVARLRPVTPDDKSLLTQGLDRLSDESRYYRFMSRVDHLTNKQLAYLTEIDYVNHFAWGALLVSEPEAPAVGIARYVRLRSEDKVAEAAVVVQDAYQGRGLGTLLLRALGAVALHNGINNFASYALAENRASVKLLERLGAESSVDSPGVVLLNLEIPKMLDALHSTPLYEVLKAAAQGDELCVIGRVLAEP